MIRLKHYLYSTLLACISLTAVLAQEGHPLVGSWHGTWGPSATQRNDVSIVMFWDGKTITGMVSPGPDSIKLQNASLDPNGWLVHFEGDAKDKEGKPVRLTVDGKIENITNVRRAITGTWTQGAVKGDFKISRDN